jgi:hypothetical protein
MENSTLLNVVSLVISSGVATAVVGLFSTLFSRRGDKQKQVNPNGERRRLQNEVNWLRKQLEEQND